MATTAVLKGNQLVITTDWDAQGVPSSSGKTIIHGTTHGGQKMDIGGKQCTINLSVYSKK